MLLFGCIGYKGFCHRTESDLLLIFFCFLFQVFKVALSFVDHYVPVVINFMIYQRLSMYIIKWAKKQNRSTEGCSKLKRSVDLTSSGKNGLNIRTNASTKWDRIRCLED